MLKLEKVSAGYNGELVIKNISFSVENGEQLTIIGPNGCGKSTLLKTLGRLLEFNGEIKINNKDIKEFDSKSFANEVALLSQTSAMYFPYTVYEAVSLGRYSRQKGLFPSLSDEDIKVIEESLMRVGILKEKNKMINELSGGQLQRVFLARAFAQEPEILLLDEPTNHLDLKCQLELLEYVNTWTKENNKVVISVLHDLNLVQGFSKRVILMKDGEIVLDGESKEVLKSSNLNEVYGINVKEYMKQTLNKWMDDATSHIK